MLTTCAQRLCHVAERLSGRAWSGQRRPGAPLSGRRSPRDPREFGAVGACVQSAAFARSTSWRGWTAKGRRARRSSRIRPPTAGYDFVLFFSFRYYHAYHGARAVRREGILVPTAERDGAIGLGIFAAHFPRRARADVQLVRRARADSAVSNNHDRARRRRRHRVRDSGAAAARAFRQKFGHHGPLRDLRRPHRREQGMRGAVRLLPALHATLPRGPAAGADRQADLPIPVTRASGISALWTIRTSSTRWPRPTAGHAVVLRKPVDGRARGVGAGQAGARQRAAATCWGQCVRSNAGLYYESYARVRRNVARDLREPPSSDAFGGNGREFFQPHYAWPVIERKYLDMFERLKAPAEGRSSRDGAAAWLVREPAEGTAAGDDVLAERAIRTGAADDSAERSTRCWRRSATAMPSATKCSASSACCAAPATSPTFSSRPPTRGSKTSPSTIATCSDASHPDNILIHHFSIGSRASRIAYALPDRMVLVYHNITPPEYFVDVHAAGAAVLPGPPRAVAPTRPLRSRAWRFRIQPPGARSARFPRTGVLPVVPDFSHLAGSAD